MNKVYVKSGEVVKVLDLGKQIEEARKVLIKEKESQRLKEIHNYKNGLGELRARWEGSVK